MLNRAEAVTIGSRRELFLDDWLVEDSTHIERRLHAPVPREAVLRFDQPWEGPACCYPTVFQDGDRYRLYYACYPFSTSSPDQYTGYAESVDGIHWEKPALDLVDFQGSRKNNLIWSGREAHNFAPFIDTRPGVPPEERYKAVTGEPSAFALASADGVHWRKLREAPILPHDHPAFSRLGIVRWDENNLALGCAVLDSLNIAFWDGRRGEYAFYFRGWVRGPGTADRIRTMFRCRSDDFLEWSEPEAVEFDVPPSPLDQFYTQGILPYFRAPHLYVALPMRLAARVRLSPWPDRDGIGETVLMSSRDGRFFARILEPFLRPGPDVCDWSKHSQMMAWGMLSLTSDEISLYCTRHHYAPTAHLQRLTLRPDGFVSLRAPYAGGEFTTRPLVFAGCRLEINVSTGVAGSVRVEIQDPSGRPLPGFGLDDCRAFYGDRIDAIAEWTGGPDLRHVAGRPVRLRFAMREADLYALRFPAAT